MHNLLSHDAMTVAPSCAGAGRSKTVAVLEEVTSALLRNARTLHTVETLRTFYAELTTRERRMTELLQAEVEKQNAIPPKQGAALQAATAVAYEAWEKAKAGNDFSVLAPHLEKVFALLREIGAELVPDGPTLDAWLGKYEKGSTTEACDRFFSCVRTRLVPLLERVQQSERYRTQTPLDGRFPVERQKLLARFLMDTMRLDPQHTVLQESPHPGTMGMTKYDVRITTRYETTSLLGLFMVMHEGGHALYESSVADENAFTLLGTYASMSLHESQSRFYEILVGHSRPFLTWLTPKLKEAFPETLACMSAEDIYRGCNQVNLTPIRMAADELTYPLHIMVRYELEKQIFDGTLRVCDLPEAWRELYRGYLGIDVQSDREGVLQDSHWPYGAVGYFPSYVFGNAYSVQLMQAIRKSVDVDSCLSTGDLLPINAWLEQHIWRYGKYFEPKVLLERACGTPFDPQPYLDHLERKYSDLYER